MESYTYYGAPWKDYNRTITTVIISSGITSIGANAFYYAGSLSSVAIGPDVEKIESNAFSGCYALSRLYVGNHVKVLETNSLRTTNTIYFAGTREEWQAMKGDSAAYGCKVTFAYDTQYDLTNSGKVTVNGSGFTFNGNVQTPDVSVTVAGKTLTKGTDYTLAYSNNINAGKANVTAVGKGNYRGMASAEFVISPKKLADSDVSKVNDVIYSGTEIKPSPTVTSTLSGSKKTTLQVKRDYSLTYSNNKNAGKATVTVTGTGNYSGSIKRNFTINSCSITSATVSNVSDKSYTGSSVTQNPTVRITIYGNSYTLKNGTDYKLSYKNNKAAGTATVIITGQGNFSGSISKNFKITKGAAAVKFEKETITSSKIGATFTNKVTTASKGKKSYKSSNSNVAKVNSKGEVTTKGYGTATITVTVAATDDFKESTAKYTVKVNKVIGWSDLRYSFSNSRKGFGYSSDYTIPYSRYKMTFGDRADSVYRQYGGRAWGGNCFGMCTSSSLMNNSSFSMKVKEFKSSASKVSDLKLSNRSDKHDLTLLQYIEVMQISQYSSLKSNEIWAHRNDLEGLVKAVNAVASNGQPVIVAIYSDNGGHALVGYEVDKVDSEKTRLRVYDPNFPNDKRSITLYTSKGKYTGWYYKMNDRENWGSKYSGCWISYNTYSVYEKLWSGAASPLNSLVTNSQNFEILDKNGSPVAEMKDGVFHSDLNQIREMPLFDVITEEHVIELPIGNYSFVNHQEDLETLTLSTADTLLSVSAENTALTATINADTAVDTVRMAPSNKEEYQVKFDSLMLQEQGIDILAFTGVGKGEQLMVGVKDGQYVYENCEEMQVMVNGEVVEDAVPGGAQDPTDDAPDGN